MDGTTFTAETILAVENGFGSQTWVVSDGDGNKWTVSYKASFIGLEGDDVVAKALENDPTANKMVFDEDLSTAGTWNPNDRTLSSLVSPAGEVLSYMKSKYMTKIAICLIS